MLSKPKSLELPSLTFTAWSLTEGLSQYCSLIEDEHRNLQEYGKMLEMLLVFICTLAFVKLHVICLYLIVY